MAAALDTQSFEVDAEAEEVMREIEGVGGVQPSNSQQTSTVHPQTQCCTDAGKAQLALARRVRAICGLPGQVYSEVLASIQCNGLPEPLASEVTQETAEAALSKMRDYQRLMCKQQRPMALKLPTERELDRFLAEALAAEADEPGALATTVRRQHVHFTHVHTGNPEHKQPGDFTRPQIFAHIEKVFREVYPDPKSPTGSILAFGSVAKEKKGQEHHHIPTFSTSQYYWNKVAHWSLKKFKVPLNAVAHQGYLTMYAYIRTPTAKKPLADLDAELWHSKYHPRGQALTDLLKSCKMSGQANGQRQPKSGDTLKRKRLSLFEEIKGNDIQSVEALRAHAGREAEQGRNALAEYCARQGQKLEEVLSNVRSIIDAPRQLSGGKTTLVEKLQKAAVDLPCECRGQWAPGAAAILQRNGIEVQTFCSSVLRALHLGAKRGANVACVGAGGCGKSSLLEPLEKIFSCSPKPEEGSSFPLASAAGHEVLLWQDYEHDEKTVRFTDLLSFLMGESVAVRRPGMLNSKLKNQSPCFYSGRSQMALLPSRRHSPEVCAQYNGMMSERFTVFEFTAPIPMVVRDMAWPQCARCAAGFVLQHGSLVAAVQSQPQSQVAPSPSAPPTGALTADLERLVQLRDNGVLDEEEFLAAKRQLLQM
jgi:hypothetical protein